MNEYFKKPTIVYTSIHVSGIRELGIGYKKEVSFVLTLKSVYKKGMEISIEDFDKIKNAELSIRGKYGDHCACCSANYEIIDRGVPLCDEHDRKQDKINSKRPDLFLKEFTWDESDPMEIIFR